MRRSAGANIRRAIQNCFRGREHLYDGYAGIQFSLYRGFGAGGAQGLFPEFEAYEDECRFLGCVHIGERECGVKTAVQEHKIGQSRYDNYRLMYQELKEKKKYGRSSR